MAALSAKGRLLVFPRDEMREMPRGRGVIVMGLDHGEKMIGIALTTGRRVIVWGSNRAGREVMATLEAEALTKHLLHRARKGALVAHKMKPVRLG